MTKPTTLKEYLAWLRNEWGIEIGPSERNYYEVATRAMKDHLERAQFWPLLLSELPEYDAAYLAKCGFLLLMSRDRPAVDVKPFDSTLDKSYRKNVVLNKDFPNPPTDGWILPHNWLTALHDVVRTAITVKYLDGVTYLAERIERLASGLGHEVTVDWEAREEGYYAAHVNIRLPAEVPSQKWDTEKIDFNLEIQLTTQMQEAIRILTHDYYVGRRSTPTASGRKWQWDYDSDEFKANYLSHTLHHLEGLIMQVRGRKS
jgi:hypothetical protein